MKQKQLFENGNRGPGLMLGYREKQVHNCIKIYKEEKSIDGGALIN